MILLETRLTGAAKMTRGQILECVLELEDLLRLVVKTTLAGQRDDWASLLPERVRERLTEARDRADRNRWGPRRGDELLDHATLSDLDSTILHRWVYFEPVFQDKTLFAAKISELRLYRNAMVHGALPEAEDKIKTIMLAHDLLERIPRSFLESRPRSRRARAITRAQRTVDTHAATLTNAGDFLTRVRAGWLRAELLALRVRTDVEVDQLTASPSMILLLRGNRGVLARLIVGQTSLVSISPTGPVHQSPLVTIRRQSDVPRFRLWLRQLLESE